MSLGYVPPVPAFAGPDAGEVRNNAALAIAGAAKTKIGVTADLAPVWRLDTSITWTDIISVYDQYKRWIGTDRAARSLAAGAIVLNSGDAPTCVWVDYATSTEHNNSYIPEEIVPQSKAEREIHAAFAARWVIQNLEIPPCHDANTWFDFVCRVFVGQTKGMAGGNGSFRDMAYEAIRQFKQGESDVSKKSREEAARRLAEEVVRINNSPFAVLAALRR